LLFELLVEAPWKQEGARFRVLLGAPDSCRPNGVDRQAK
jgi:hypothetical protein